MSADQGFSITGANNTNWSGYSVSRAGDIIKAINLYDGLERTFDSMDKVIVYPKATVYPEGK